jgi:hypothetical protein
MSMVKFDVNTTLKLFIAKPGVVSFDVQIDFYSDAKEHWLAGGLAMGFKFPIRVIGGDPVGGGTYAGDIYFLSDGWKIRPDEADHTLIITGGLFLDEGEVGNLIIPTVGDFTVVTIAERSNLVLAKATGTMAPTQQQIRDALALATLSAPAVGSIDARLPSALTAGRINANVGALEQPALDSITNGLLDLAAVADGRTLREIFRLIGSYCGGKSSGGVSDDTIRSMNDLKDRIVATLDANGHRTAVTLDLSP